MTRPLHVLIVDDSPEDTATYLRYLRGWPEWHVTLSQASLGEDAADMLRGTTPDLILLDYQLPDMTGIEFLNEFRPDCAVIVLTGVGDEEIAVQAMRAGAQDYLVKGRLTPDALRRAAQAALNTHRLSRALEEARTQQAALLSSITDGVLLVDAHLTVQSVNPAAQQLLGADDSLLGASLLTLDWLTGTPLPDLLRGAGGGSAQLLTPQGRWLHARVFPAEQGQTVYLYDDTPRREIEARDHAHARQLTDLYALAATLNAARTRVDVQRIARDAAPALLGSEAHLLLPGEAPPPATAGDPDWQTTPLTHDGDPLGKLLRGPAGDQNPLAPTFTQLLHTALVRAALLERVQRDRDTLDDRVQARTAALERSNRDLEQFAHVASHDLKEPLRTIASFTQLLQGRYGAQLDDRGRRYMGIIVDGAQRMSTLIEDVLAISRLHARPTPPTRTDLNVLLRDVLTQLQALLDETGGQVEAGPLPTLTLNPTQFTQLFLNLIGNALKFHRPGVPPRVHLSATKAGDTWHFTLRDNGIGVPAEYAERVFVIFQRLHTRDQYAGNGIGLALCRRIVEARGGRIWLNPDTDPGTELHFTLPEVVPAIDPDMPSVRQPVSDLAPPRPDA
ncbi:ATP-binding protein [Deinococcus sp. JMULE3]|uniref:ATP-binding protein n=1 Tax=Deinococcus sp. JMULE3 TaxID=2518341 RepID=UPI001575E948